MARIRRRGGEKLENVWDYPLPPAVEKSAARCQVILNGFLIADSDRTVRVLTMGLPPSYYFPPGDVQLVYLRATSRAADLGELGRASFYDVVVADRRVADAAWTLRDPGAGYETLRDRLAFYPSRMDACFVNGEAVRHDTQEDSGGWITPGILGLSRGYPPHWRRP